MHHKLKVYYQVKHIKNLLGHKYFFCVVLAYTGLIAWLSLAQLKVPQAMHFDASDKIGHLVAYFFFVLIWFVFLWFAKWQYSFKKSILIAVCVGLVYGLLMEVLQSTLTNYRTADWLDMVANTTGALVAAVVLKLFQNKIINSIK